MSRVPSEINSTTCSDKSDTQSSGYPSSASSGDMDSQFRETGSACESVRGHVQHTRQCERRQRQLQRRDTECPDPEPGLHSRHDGAGGDFREGEQDKRSELNDKFPKICDLPAA